MLDTLQSQIQHICNGQAKKTELDYYKLRTNVPWYNTLAISMESRDT